MAHTSSAKKRIRQDAKRRARSRWRKGLVKQAVREFTDAVRDGDKDKAGEKLRVVYQRLDKVAAKGTIHKNAAARSKSRLAKLLQKIES